MFRCKYHITNAFSLLLQFSSLHINFAHTFCISSLVKQGTKLNFIFIISFSNPLKDPIQAILLTWYEDPYFLESSFAFSIFRSFQTYIISCRLNSKKHSRNIVSTNSILPSLSFISRTFCKVLPASKYLVKLTNQKRIELCRNCSGVLTPYLTVLYIISDE